MNDLDALDKANERLINAVDDLRAKLWSGEQHASKAGEQLGVLELEASLSQVREEYKSKLFELEHRNFNLKSSLELKSEQVCMLEGNCKVMKEQFTSVIQEQQVMQEQLEASKQVHQQLMEEKQDALEDMKEKLLVAENQIHMTLQKGQASEEKYISELEQSYATIEELRQKHAEQSETFQKLQFESTNRFQQMLEKKDDELKSMYIKLDALQNKFLESEQQNSKLQEQLSKSNSEQSLESQFSILLADGLERYHTSIAQPFLEELGSKVLASQQTISNEIQNNETGATVQESIKQLCNDMVQQHTAVRQWFDNQQQSIDTTAKVLEERITQSQTHTQENMANKTEKYVQQQLEFQRLLETRISNFSKDIQNTIIAQSEVFNIATLKSAISEAIKVEQKSLGNKTNVNQENVFLSNDNMIQMTSKLKESQVELIQKVCATFERFSVETANRKDKEAVQVLKRIKGNLSQLDKENQLLQRENQSLSNEIHNLKQERSTLLASKEDASNMAKLLDDANAQLATYESTEKEWQHRLKLKEDEIAEFRLKFVEIEEESNRLKNVKKWKQLKMKQELKKNRLNMERKMSGILREIASKQHLGFDTEFQDEAFEDSPQDTIHENGTIGSSTQYGHSEYDPSQYESSAEYDPEDVDTRNTVDYEVAMALGMEYEENET